MKTLSIALIILGFALSKGTSAETFECTLRLDVFRTSCTYPVLIEEINQDASRALVSVDMSEGWQCLKMRAVVMEPEGFLLNIGNSPTNNGGGGDGSTFSNDSELDVIVTEANSGGVLRAYANDFSNGPRLPGGSGAQPILRIDDFLAPFRRIDFEIGDQCLYAKGRKNSTLQSEFIYRLGGLDEEAGENDFTYWVGVNRVITGLSSRNGSGVQRVRFVLSTDPCEPCLNAHVVE